MKLGEGLYVTASKKQSVSVCVINWRILHRVHACSLQLLSTLTELTTLQLLPVQLAHCWLGLRGSVA